MSLFSWIRFGLSKGCNDKPDAAGSYGNSQRERLQKVMGDVLLSALAARIAVSLELLQSGRTNEGIGALVLLLKQMPAPTPEGLEIARVGIEQYRNS